MKELNVAKCIQLIAEAYPARWKPTKQTTEIWNQLLIDISDEHGLAAVLQLCSSSDWPPTISQIRQLAFDLSDGNIMQPSPWEAWERVLAGEKLTSIELRALKTIGGIWAIKHSENVGVERSNFVKAYTDFLTSERREKMAIPAIRELMESNKPQPLLPAPKKQEELENINIATAEEIRNLLKNNFKKNIDDE